MLTNAQAQSPAEEHGGGKRYGERHKPGFEKSPDSAGRLERNVRRHAD